MTSIVEVSTHWPSQISIAEHQQDLRLSDTEIRRYTRGFGLSEVCWDKERSEKDILLGALEKLTSLRGQEDRVRYILRPRTLRSPSPYPLSPLQEIREEAGLHNARTFALTEHACASGLLALDVAGMLLDQDEDPDALALILVGEKSPSVECRFLPGVGATGEATAAVLVAPSGHRDRVLGFSTRTRYTGDPKMAMTDQATRCFRDMYAELLVGVVNEALDEAGLGIGDISLLLPHNVNRVAWTNLVDAMGIPLDRLLMDNIPRTGHCFGADPFINYGTARELGRLNPGDRYLMAAVGLGANFAAMVLEH